MKAVTEINSKNSINRVTKGAYLDAPCFGLVKFRRRTDPPLDETLVYMIIYLFNGILINIL